MGKIEDVNKEQLILYCKEQIEDVKQSLNSFYNNENLLLMIDEDQYKLIHKQLIDKLHYIKLRMGIK